jgi:hypothetical protein
LKTGGFSRLVASDAHQTAVAGPHRAMHVKRHAQRALREVLAPFAIGGECLA